jgi:3D (Asp-Asp-Asp) domain-containing protein
MQTSTGWGAAVVVDPQWLDEIQGANAMLRRSRAVLKTCVGVLAVGCVVAGTVGYRQAHQLSDLDREVHAYRRSAHRSDVALGVLARSHEDILTATQKAPSIGTQSWAHRFTVTQYTPRSAAYGKFNDGLTSTLEKADPASRIVAVDPKLVPYGSSVWIENLGWFHAADCGSAIKGYRLDVLAANDHEAMDYGKQDRFVIVVPPGDA